MDDEASNFRTVKKSFENFIMKNTEMIHNIDSTLLDQSDKMEEFPTQDRKRRNLIILIANNSLAAHKFVMSTIEYRNTVNKTLKNDTRPSSISGFYNKYDHVSLQALVTTDDILSLPDYLQYIDKFYQIDGWEVENVMNGVKEAASSIIFQLNSKEHLNESKKLGLKERQLTGPDNSTANVPEKSKNENLNIYQVFGSKESETKASNVIKINAWNDSEEKGANPNCNSNGSEGPSSKISNDPISSRKGVIEDSTTLLNDTNPVSNATFLDEKAESLTLNQKPVRFDLLVWPGWGHCSENSEFPYQLEVLAQRLKNKNINLVFCGPSALATHLLGDKVWCSLIGSKMGVKVIPFVYERPNMDNFYLNIKKKDQNAKFLFKSPSLGGGKGIIPIENFEEIKKFTSEHSKMSNSENIRQKFQMNQSQKVYSDQSKNFNFGREEIYSTTQEVQHILGLFPLSESNIGTKNIKFIETMIYHKMRKMDFPDLLTQKINRPRHIELQVVANSYVSGDTSDDGSRHGKIVEILFLSTRDCTVQRRHQKLIEEGPAIIEKDLECLMRQDVVKMIVASGYKGVLTFEFLVYSDFNSNNNGKVHVLLEINTRLQVEHPVTEQICSINLPFLQIKLALGDKISECLKDRQDVRIEKIQIITDQKQPFVNTKKAPLVDDEKERPKVSNNNIEKGYRTGQKYIEKEERCDKINSVIQEKHEESDIPQINVDYSNNNISNKKEQNLQSRIQNTQGFLSANSLDKSPPTRGSTKPKSIPSQWPKHSYILNMSDLQMTTLVDSINLHIFEISPIGHCLALRVTSENENFVPVTGELNISVLSGQNIENHVRLDQMKPFDYTNRHQNVLKKRNIQKLTNHSDINHQNSIHCTTPYQDPTGRQHSAQIHQNIDVGLTQTVQTIPGISPLQSGKCSDLVYFTKTNGKLNTFSDLQFGHIFTHTQNRTLSIQRMQHLVSKICTGIQTPIKLLSRIINTSKFKDNQYHTESISEFLNDLGSDQKDETLTPLLVSIISLIIERDRNDAIESSNKNHGPKETDQNKENSSIEFIHGKTTYKTEILSELKKVTLVKNRICPEASDLSEHSNELIAKFPYNTGFEYFSKQLRNEDREKSSQTQGQIGDHKKESKILRNEDISENLHQSSAISHDIDRNKAPTQGIYFIKHLLQDKYLENVSAEKDLSGDITSNACMAIIKFQNNSFFKVSYSHFKNNSFLINNTLVRYKRSSHGYDFWLYGRNTDHKDHSFLGVKVPSNLIYSPITGCLVSIFDGLKEKGEILCVLDVMKTRYEIRAEKTAFYKRKIKEQRVYEGQVLLEFTLENSNLNQHKFIDIPSALQLNNITEEDRFTTTVYNYTVKECASFKSLFFFPSDINIFKLIGKNIDLKTYQVCKSVMNQTKELNVSTKFYRNTLLRIQNINSIENKHLRNLYMAIQQKFHDSLRHKNTNIIEKGSRKSDVFNHNKIVGLEQVPNSNTSKSCKLLSTKTNANKNEPLFHHHIHESDPRRVPNLGPKGSDFQNKSDFHLNECKKSSVLHMNHPVENKNTLDIRSKTNTNIKNDKGTTFNPVHFKIINDTIHTDSYNQFVKKELEYFLKTQKKIFRMQVTNHVIFETIRNENLERISSVIYEDRKFHHLSRNIMSVNEHIKFKKEQSTYSIVYYSIDDQEMTLTAKMKRLISKTLERPSSEHLNNVEQFIFLLQIYLEEKNSKYSMEEIFLHDEKMDTGEDLDDTEQVVVSSVKYDTIVNDEASNGMITYKDLKSNKNRLMKESVEKTSTENLKLKRHSINLKDIDCHLGSHKFFLSYRKGVSCGLRCFKLRVDRNILWESIKYDTSNIDTKKENMNKSAFFLDIIFTVNDRDVQLGSLSHHELLLFHLTNQLCILNNWPKINICNNSGVRIGVDTKALKNVRVHPDWLLHHIGNTKNEKKNVHINSCNNINGNMNCNDPNIKHKNSASVNYTDNIASANGHINDTDNVLEFDHVSDYQNIPFVSDVSKNVYLDNVCAENLSYSSLCSNSTIKLYDSVFCLSLITKHAIGIGAYLAVLQKRIIMVDKSHILLTGYRTLNKLLSYDKYSNNEQVGGYDILKHSGTVQMRSFSIFTGICDTFKWLGYSLLNKIKDRGSKITEGTLDRTNLSVTESSSYENNSKEPVSFKQGTNSTNILKSKENNDKGIPDLKDKITYLGTKKDHSNKNTTFDDAKCISKPMIKGSGKSSDDPDAKITVESKLHFNYKTDSPDLPSKFSMKHGGYNSNRYEKNLFNPKHESKISRLSMDNQRRSQYIEHSRFITNENYNQQYIMNFSSCLNDITDPDTLCQALFNDLTEYSPDRVCNIKTYRGIYKNTFSNHDVPSKKSASGSSVFQLDDIPKGHKNVILDSCNPVSGQNNSIGPDDYDGRLNYINQAVAVATSTNSFVLDTKSTRKLCQFIDQVDKETEILVFLFNLKGFSGDSTNMEDGILLEGAKLLEQLSKIKKLIVYITNEVRGGTYVILDRLLNDRKTDKNISCGINYKGRIGVLEAKGLKEVKMKRNEGYAILKRSLQYIKEKNLLKPLKHVHKHGLENRSSKNNSLDEANLGVEPNTMSILNSIEEYNHKSQYEHMVMSHQQKGSPSGPKKEFTGDLIKKMSDCELNQIQDHTIDTKTLYRDIKLTISNGFHNTNDMNVNTQENNNQIDLFELESHIDPNYCLSDQISISFCDLHDQPIQMRKYLDVVENVGDWMQKEIRKKYEY